MRKILCVAEKPAIAKAVAGHLSGGAVRAVSPIPVDIDLSSPHCTDWWLPQNNTRCQYVKNYMFTFDFGPPWGNCEAIMTSVLGHLTQLEFGPEHKDWKFPPPVQLFNAPVLITVPDVRGRYRFPSRCVLLC